MKELRYGLVAVAVIGTIGCIALYWIGKAVPAEFVGIIGSAVGALAGIAVGRHVPEPLKPIEPEDPKETP